jgi:predicted ArsR family transcriptional regulator
VTSTRSPYRSGRPGGQEAPSAASRDQRTVELRNCPFHSLARRAPEVVCAVNRSLLEGLLRGLGDRRVEAVLAPRPDACCVELRAPRPRR